MRRVWSSIIGGLAVLGILVGINLAADGLLSGAQLDLSEGKIYTLSAGTRQLLSGLKEPVTLRLFYSRDMGARVPSYGAYAERVRQMLREYAQLAGGKLRLEFYNPEPFSDLEDRALAYGLQGVPLDQSGEQVYFGLVGTNLLDDTRTIGFFQPDRERFLEYDLSRVIYELSNPTRPVIGVMTSLPLMGDPRAMMMRGAAAARPWVSAILMRQSFAVRTLPLDAWSIPADVKVLLVAHAQNLSEPALYAIDQFVMRGGRLMVMVDPYSEAQAGTPGPNGMPRMDLASDLHRLFDAWGIAYDPSQVVGDLDGAWQVRAGPEDRVSVVNYVPWFSIRDGINRTDPATGDLDQVTVADAGFIAKKPGAAIEFTPILQSSAQSGLIPAETIRTSPNPSELLANFKPEGGPRVIAARVRGVLKSAFTAPPAAPKGSQAPADLPSFRANSETPANLVVVADSDILANRFWVRVESSFGEEQATPFASNGPFVANLLGSLAGGDMLLGLRGRGVVSRPFTVVDAMQRDAEARFRRTEQTLQKHLQETQKKLAELRQGNAAGGAAGGGALLTPEQQQAIDAADREVLQTRKQLRAVQLDLKHDIDRLDVELRLFDIVAVPAVLTVIAIGLGLARRRRRTQARA